MEFRSVGYNFERGKHKDHFSQILFKLAQQFQRRRFNSTCYQNMLNLHNRDKSAERNISEKTPECMLKLLIVMQFQLEFEHILIYMIKQQWKIEEISFFSNSSNLQWRAELSDTNLKVDHPRIMSAKFDLIWFSCFREEDLNVRRTDAK